MLAQMVPFGLSCSPIVILCSPQQNYHLCFVLILMNKNFRSKELPSNYAWELLESEIELELGERLTIGLVQKLLELYALGVEYYESLRSYKYLYFQRKMNGLMVSQKVMQTMSTPQPPKPAPSSGSGPTPSAEQESEHHHRVLLAKNRQQELEKQLVYSKEEVSAAKVKTMLETTQQQANNLHDKIQDELNKQHTSILEKVERRKRNAFMRKSLSVADMTRHSSSELGVDSDEGKDKDKDRKGRLDKIQVDFSNVINENEEEEDKPPSVRKNVQGKLQEKVLEKNEANQLEADKKLQQPPKLKEHLRKRNNTLVRAATKTKGQEAKDKHNNETHSQGLPQISELDDLLI